MWYRIIFAVVFTIMILLSPVAVMADPIVSIPERIPADPNTIVHVPVNISQVTNLASFNMRIFYDTDDLDLTNVDVTLGSLILGVTDTWGVVANVQDDLGRVNVSGFGTTNITGAGEILDLAFHVQFSSGISELELDGVFVGGYDEQGASIVIPVTTGDGSIQVSSIPEPATVFTWGLLALIGAGVAIGRRRWWGRSSFQAESP